MLTKRNVPLRPTGKLPSSSSPSGGNGNLAVPLNGDTEDETEDQNAGKNVTLLLGIVAMMVVTLIVYRWQSMPQSARGSALLASDNGGETSDDSAELARLVDQAFGDKDAIRRSGDIVDGREKQVRLPTTSEEEEDNSLRVEDEARDDGVVRPSNDEEIMASSETVDEEVVKLERVAAMVASEEERNREEAENMRSTPAALEDAGLRDAVEEDEEEETRNVVGRVPATVTESSSSSYSKRGAVNLAKPVENQADLKKRTPRRVPSLGNFLFYDAEEYEAAPFITLNIEDGKPFKGMWALLNVHEEYYAKHPHKRYVPRLAESITREQFHEVFRKTSTPVIIPFEHSRRLGFITQSKTMEELRREWPYEPPPAASASKFVPPEARYTMSSGKKSKLDLGPAVYAISRDAKLEKIAYGVRNFPRNLQLSSKNLAQLKASRPPYVQSKRFQPASIWFGTTTSDTKFHHDCCDNFVMMITGVKRWFLAPVTDWRVLRPVRCEGEHQSLCWASVPYPNAKNLTEEQRGVLSRLNSIIVELQPGEQLYLPAGWWHHIQNLTPTAMLNHWTYGCQNVGMALELDPTRKDRPEFKSCSSNAKAEASWRKRMDLLLMPKSEEVAAA